jgi:hypothetical protein
VARPVLLRLKCITEPAYRATMEMQMSELMGAVLRLTEIRNMRLLRNLLAATYVA